MLEAPCHRFCKFVLGSGKLLKVFARAEAKLVKGYSKPVVR